MTVESGDIQVSTTGSAATSNGTSHVRESTVPSPPVTDQPNTSIWRRLIAGIRARYFELPPAPTGRGAGVSLAVVLAMMALFTAFFTLYSWRQHDAFLTNGEDLGIMDQALWNVFHGAFLHQTICNPISDTNCLGDVPRFAIHFEPILLPISLLYLVVPSVKVLTLLQAAVVSTGALPACWIASRRFQHPLAGVAFAAAYLMYFPLQQAVTFDFHAVTLSAAFLLFALYFMLTRNNRGLLIASLLALSTKESVPFDVIMIGLLIIVGQRRWRVGLGLIGLAAGWLVMAMTVMHFASPYGHPPTLARYSYLGDTPTQAAGYLLTHPVQVLRDHALDATGIYYLRSIMSPLGYLPLLSPFTLVVALPVLAINLLSTTPQMHAGIHQYSAEVVPVMLLSAIMGAALLFEAVTWLYRRLQPWLMRLPRQRWIALPPNLRSSIPRLTAHLSVGALVLCIALPLLGLRSAYKIGDEHLPFSYNFTWPEVTPHDYIGNDVLEKIPADASVSAQSLLVPHLSHRRLIYQYPYNASTADYVVLDLTSSFYPFDSCADYVKSLDQLRADPSLRLLAVIDGYILATRVKPAPGDATQASPPLRWPDTTDLCRSLNDSTQAESNSPATSRP